MALNGQETSEDLSNTLQIYFGVHINVKVI